MTRKQKTLYIDIDWYSELRDLVRPKPISRELDDLIFKRIVELRGNVKPEDQIDYDGLKKDHVKLLKEVEKLEAILHDRGVYERLEHLAYASGLEWDGKLLNNLEKATKGILAKWKGVSEDAHTFISLLEAVDAKSRIEKQLEMVRLGEFEVEAETPPLPTTAQTS